jgi:hypothetical protein
METPMCAEMHMARPILRLSWPWRIGLGLLSIVGTAFWAWSFGDGWGEAFTVPIAISAGGAWVGLGLTVWLWRAGGRSLGEWADLSLVTQTCGMALLLCAAMGNVAALHWSWEMHAAVLFGADTLMAGVFVDGARRMNVRWGTSLLLWFGALHMFFITIAVLVVWGAGGMR